MGPPFGKEIKGNCSTGLSGGLEALGLERRVCKLSLDQLGLVLEASQPESFPWRSWKAGGRGGSRLFLLLLLLLLLSLLYWSFLILFLVPLCVVVPVPSNGSVRFVKGGGYTLLISPPHSSPLDSSSPVLSRPLLSMLLHSSHLSSPLCSLLC